ncbi:hypothetical protein [Stieleria sp.]|uniref:hypothetical protein n=1 Tax=Stieleria sp. TaxID=2795976 RepID=UPI003568915F
MGYSTSWIAVTLPQAEARSRFSVRPTGRRSEFAEFTLSDAVLPNGWYLIVANRCDWAALQDLHRLSTGGELVTAYVEEHVMVSGSSQWRDGGTVWDVEHNSELAADHLAESGVLPDGYRKLADELLEKQKTIDDCDYIFDIPLVAAKLVTGYQHDEDGPWTEGEPFEILESVRPWWRFW